MSLPLSWNLRSRVALSKPCLPPGKTLLLGPVTTDKDVSFSWSRSNYRSLNSRYVSSSKLQYKLSEFLYVFLFLILLLNMVSFPHLNLHTEPNLFGRSLAACEILYNAGYRNLFWVQGGLEAAEEEVRYYPKTSSEFRSTCLFSGLSSFSAFFATLTYLFYSNQISF